ncbi:MAG: NADH:flavin oxidoreductase/NADH oxidase [Variibacter sp.]
MSSVLFSPIKLADVELPNRIVVAPMCQYSADDGSATDWHLTHLGMLANSGAGLVVVEATHVERQGRITHGCLGLYSDDNEAALARVIAHCRRIGTAKFGVQLAHAGRKASSQRPWEGGLGLQDNDVDQPWPTIGPTTEAYGPAWKAPRQMEAADFKRVRDAFVSSAKRALRIGFDAIELHMAHGYLMHSFTSPLSNTRNDAYGGDRAGRWRFPFEVTEAVRAVVPKGVALGARITGSDWSADGIMPEEAAAFAKELKARGLDYIDVSSGSANTLVRNPNTLGYNVPLAEAVKRGSGLPTRAVGLITSPQQAEAILAEGRADMIALARGFLDNPHWGWHAARDLGANVERPKQYARVSSKVWNLPPDAKH